jgi:AhpD family alkylhydroperoxidase
MTQRIDYESVTPDGVRAMEALEAYVQGCGLDHGLLELVKMRVSQINGCAFCLAMHGPLARRHGVTQRQLDTLAAWRESPLFDARAKAALRWAESVTHVTKGIPDEDFAPMRAHFTEREIADLTWAVIVINGWNRVTIAFREPVAQG